MMITLYRNNFSKMDYKKSTNCYNKVEGWKQETFKRLRYTCFPREFNKTFEGTFFTGHLQATASVHKTCKQRLNNYFCYLVLRQCLPQVRSQHLLFDLFLYTLCFIRPIDKGIFFPPLPKFFQVFVRPILTIF